MRRTVLHVAVPAAVAVLVSPGHATRPAPTTETVPYRDATPDPSGVAVGDDGHCSGLLPREAPHEFTAPGRGSLKVTLGAFTGEWALHLLNEKGSVLAETDTTDYESLTVKVKKGSVVGIQPCNIAGTPDGTITLVFTPA